MLNTILEYMGLVSYKRFANAYMASVDLAREADTERARADELEKRLASMQIDRDLHKRESSAHAESARKQAERANRAERRYIELAQSYAGIEAHTISHTSTEDGERAPITHYTVELRNADKTVKLLSLVANTKNQKRAHDLRDAINDLINPNPAPDAQVGGGLLRPASSASSFADKEVEAGRVPGIKYKPDGFA